MRIYLGKRDILLKELGHRLETMISLLFGYKTMMIANHIRSGYKSRLVVDGILQVADDIGGVRPYRLTITLDSLAGSEKTESGMTGTEKLGENIEQ